MTDKKISELTSMIGTNVVDTDDVLAIVDTSNAQTKKITRKQLFNGVADATFDGSVTFSGSTSGISYADLDNVPSGGNRSHYTYKTRAQFVADVGDISWSDGDIVCADGIFYIRKTGASLPSLSNFDYMLSMTFMHFGAAGDGVTNDADAVQALVDRLSYSTGALAIQNGNRTTVDLMGRNYLLNNPIYIGEFDFNQDGTYELGSGAINGLKFTNGRFTANSSVSWPDAWTGQIGSFLFYVGVVTNVSWNAGNIFSVLNITFNNCGIDCGFKTGGIWAENSHRTIIDHNAIWDLGVGCIGIGSPQSVYNTRGYIPINQQLIIDTNRIEGWLRTEGEGRQPGRVSFGGGSEICIGQPTTGFSLDIDGAHTSAGVYTSTTGDPYFVEIQNVWSDTTTDDYHDFSDVEFTITGYADAAKTQPISEIMYGPPGGNKTTWSYSVRKYAVITSIVADTEVSGDRKEILVSVSYKNVGIDTGTHDSEISDNNITGCEIAAIIRARASSFTGNHPWSRDIILTSNSRKIRFTGNYIDYTNVNDYGQENRFNDNGFHIGNSSLILHASSVDDRGDGIVITGNTFAELSHIKFVGSNGNNWDGDPNYVNMGNAVVTGGATGYQRSPGYLHADAAEFEGHVTFRTSSKFEGLVNVSDYKILNLGYPTLDTDAASKIYVDSVVSGGGSLDPTFDSAIIGGTYISNTGYVTGAVGATFNGYLEVGAGGRFNGNLAMTGYKVRGLADPTLGDDAATRQWVLAQFTSRGL